MMSELMDSYHLRWVSLLAGIALIIVAFVLAMPASTAQAAGDDVIDETPPSAFDLQLPYAGEWISDNTLTLSWETNSDAESGLDYYEVWIDGVNVENVVTNKCTTSQLLTGPHKWRVAAMDKAGNERWSASTYCFVVEERPTTYYVYGSSGCGACGAIRSKLTNFYGENSIRYFNIAKGSNGSYFDNIYEEAFPGETPLDPLVGVLVENELIAISGGYPNLEKSFCEDLENYPSPTAFYMEEEHAISSSEYVADMFRQQVEPGNKPPVASFSYSPSSPTVDNTIQFIDDSHNPDGSIESWSWEFGDNSPTTHEQNPIHRYDEAGTYEVTLTVTDNGRATDEFTKTIKVKGLKNPWFVDEDNTVGLSDLIIVAHHYGESESSPNWLPAADVNGNGSVGLSDLIVVAYHYGEVLG